jgi:hypothetical protein
MDSQKKMLSNLIFIICISIIAFIGINLISCNFLIPGSINNANVNGKLKNPPPLDCKESERRGYETILALLTTIIALKARMDEE